MVARLSGEEEGKPKKFKNSRREKMGKFLESVSDLNLFNDDKAHQIRRSGQRGRKWTCSGGIAEDANLRKYIADQKNPLRIAVDGALEDLPRGKICLAA